MNQQNNNQQPQWTEVTNSSDNARWEPTKMQFQPGNEPILMGYFSDIKELPGRNGPFNVAEITPINADGSIGAVIDVSGGKVLDDILSKIKLGSFVGIKYMGKVQAKAGGNSYNSWKVFQDTSKIPFDQVPGANMRRTVSLPANNTQNNQAPATNQNQNFNQNNGQNQQFGQQNNANTGSSTFNPPAGFGQQNNQAPQNNPPQGQQQFNPNTQGQTQQNNQAPATNQNQNFNQNNGQNQVNPAGNNNGAGVQFGGQQIPGNTFNDDLPF